MARKGERARSAGFFVFRKFDGHWRVLGLKVYGMMDIPKGHVDPGETDLETAYRECEEEASLTPASLDMKWGKISYTSERPHKDVIIFLAETEDEPEIRPNPVTKQYEHHGHSWLTRSDMLRQSHKYLKPAIEWAFRVIDGDSIVERRR